MTLAGTRLTSSLSCGPGGERLTSATSDPPSRRSKKASFRGLPFLPPSFSIRTDFRRRYSPRRAMLMGCSMRLQSELSPGRVLSRAHPWWSVVPDLLPPQLSGPLLLPRENLPSPLMPGIPGGGGLAALTLLFPVCKERDGRASSSGSDALPLQGASCGLSNPQEPRGYAQGSLKGQVLRLEIQQLKAKGAIEEAPLTAGFYSHMFVVPKASGGFRPIIDLSILNKYSNTPLNEPQPISSAAPGTALAGVAPGGLSTSTRQQQQIFVDAMVCEQEVAKEVVCTKIDNYLLLGSGPGAPTYQPAAELSGMQFEIASGAQFENVVGSNRKPIAQIKLIMIFFRSRYNKNV
ncbi:hypothetical protein E2C01_033044 [Portunus trituberculatus]|uniref:Uncharacterized protein n=1 Tax=Portunus trituberculatus TaxID=210409 RepID=A0A5B7F1Y8_PORTR|nr:hypothetical protein [Portunus trituberculatus]